MGTVPIPPTFVEPMTVHDTDLNGLRDAILFLQGPPRVRVANSTGQTLTDNTWTALTWDSEPVDSDGIHSVVTAQSRLTIATPGTYLLSGGLAFVASAAGNRRAARWRLNGASTIGPETFLPAGSANTATPSVSAATILVELIAGDYIELNGYQDSGGGLATVPQSCWAQALWIAV